MKLTKWLKKLFKHKHKWVVVKLQFPYNGYGTFCKGCRTLLDANLSKARANEIVETMKDEDRIPVIGFDLIEVDEKEKE